MGSAFSSFRPLNPTPESLEQAVEAYLHSVPGMQQLAGLTETGLAEYFADNPVEVDDDYLAQKVASAVYAYLQANPPPAGPAGATGQTGQTGAAGRAPTFQEILDAVTVYLQAHPPAAGPAGPAGPQGQTGATGATGAAGRAPTAQEIAAAVAAYLTANPPQAGATGPAGQNATDAQVAAAVAAYLTANALKGWTALPDVTFLDKALVALALGPRKVTANCAGALVGDRLTLFATAGMPAGYVLGEASCLAAGVITISFYGPALLLNAQNTATLKVTAVR